MTVLCSISSNASASGELRAVDAEAEGVDEEEGAFA